MSVSSDRRSGMSQCCSAGPTVRLRRQCAASPCCYIQIYLPNIGQQLQKQKHKKRKQQTARTHIEHIYQQVLSSS